MIKLIRTNSRNDDFIHLVESVDSYLRITDGDDHEFYNQYNSIEHLNHVVVAYNNEIPVGCGAFKTYKKINAEIKRMFVDSNARGNGIATIILKEIEAWCAELLFTRCILETGKNQTEAIALYKKNNYHLITNYGPYKTISTSYCFEKLLNS